MLLAQPTFFAPDEWVAQPTDWKKTTVSGASYDLEQGEGARIWRECCERERARDRVDALMVAEPVARYGSPQVVHPRIGQGIFRVAVTDAYDRACAVSGEKSLPVLEAAHIRSYAEGGPHTVDNGLLLRSDIHRLFDRGYVTVDEDLRFVVSRRLREDYANGRHYYAMAGQHIRAPAMTAQAPNTTYLRYHRQQVFLG